MKLKQKIAIGYVSTTIKLRAILSKDKAAAKALDYFGKPAGRSRKPTPSLFSQAERTQLTPAGIPVIAYRWNINAGRKVLIIHGFESASKNFEIYIEAFIAKGYEVLAVDAPGHGESGGNRIVLPQFIETIKYVYEKFGPIQSFMAHSLGGLALALFLQNRNLGEDCRVALISPATEITTAIDQFFHVLNLDKVIREKFDRLIEESTGNKTGYYSIVKAIEHIKANIIWIHDEEDKVTPFRDVQPIMQSHPAYLNFIITKGLGHRRIYKDENTIQKVVDFL